MICVLQNFRRKTWLSCAFAALLSAFLFCLFGSSPVSAFDYDGSAWVSLTGGYVYGATNGYDDAIFNLDYDPNATYKVKMRARIRDASSMSAFAVSRIKLDFAAGYGRPNAIYHFSFRFQSLSTTEELGFMGFSPVFSNGQGDNSTGISGSMLASSCNNLRYSDSGTYNGDIQCDYYVYYGATAPTSFNFQGYVYYPAYAVGVLDVNPTVDYVTVAPSSSSSVANISVDLQTALDRLQTMITNQGIIGDEMRSIKSLLQSIGANQLTPEDIADGVSDGVSSAMEDEKDAIQDAADEAESQANTSGAQAQAQGQTLISIISGFISAITDPSGGSCVIDVDLSLYQGGTHNLVDLCHLNPPSGITTVLSILLIVFVIRAAVHVIQAMIALYREYQS